MLFKGIPRGQTKLWQLERDYQRFQLHLFILCSNKIWPRKMLAKNS